MVVRKEGGRFVVRSKAGMKLGSHATRAAALRQLAAIEVAKHRRKKGRS